MTVTIPLDTACAVLAFVAVCYWQHVIQSRGGLNDRDVRRTGFLLAVSVAATVMAVRSGDVVGTACMGGAAAVVASMLWDWWRRHRKGRPSIVAGVVRRIGDKLAVEPVPANTPRR